MIQATLKWDIIAQKTPMRTVYAVVQDGKDEIYFYGKSRGIKAEEKLKITIYEKDKILFEVLPSDVKVDTSGVIQATLKWDIIAQKTPMRTVYAVVQDGKDEILYNGAKTPNCGVAITKKSALLGLAEYKSAVLVKKFESNFSNKDSKKVDCECEARVRAFLRTIKEKRVLQVILDMKQIVKVNHL